MSELSVLEAPRKRRRFTAAFKARIAEACQQPGASVASIALEHALNANLVHKWIRAASQQKTVTETPALVPVPPATTDLPASPSTAGEICIELLLARGTITEC